MDSFKPESIRFEKPPVSEVIISLGFDRVSLPLSRYGELVERFRPSWLPQVLKWAQDDRLEEAVDKLFEEVDGWLREGHFYPCNQLLELPAALFPLRLSVSLLALTRPAADRLPARTTFLNKVREIIEANGRDAEAVLGRLSD